MACLLATKNDLLKNVRGSARQFLQILFEVDLILGQSFCGVRVPLVIMLYLACYSYGSVNNFHSKNDCCKFFSCFGLLGRSLSNMGFFLQKCKMYNSFTVFGGFLYFFFSVSTGLASQDSMIATNLLTYPPHPDIDYPISWWCTGYGHRVVDMTSRCVWELSVHSCGNSMRVFVEYFCVFFLQ